MRHFSFTAPDLSFLPHLRSRPSSRRTFSMTKNPPNQSSGASRMVHRLGAPTKASAAFRKASAQQPRLLMWVKIAVTTKKHFGLWKRKTLTPAASRRAITIASSSLVATSTVNTVGTKERVTKRSHEEDDKEEFPKWSLVAKKRRIEEEEAEAEKPGPTRLVQESIRRISEKHTQFNFYTPSVPSTPSSLESLSSRYAGTPYHFRHFHLLRLI